MQDNKPYCYKICPLGKAYFDDLMQENGSIFDVASDFETFCSKCSETCPYKMDRDWTNPDGIEWWNLKNIDRHSYGNPKKLIGDIFSIKRFREYVADRTITAYDGNGYYCTETEATEKSVSFWLDDIDKKIKQGYKYVIWCNK